MADRPRDGQRVRVVLEGVKASASIPDEVFTLRLDGGGEYRFRYDRVSIEPLPDPEPAWWPPQPGDIIHIGDNPAATWLREAVIGLDDPEQYGSRMWTSARGSRITDQDVLDTQLRNNDVTLLVRAGKPYDEETDHRPQITEAEYLAGVGATGSARPVPHEPVTVDRHDLAFVLRSNVRLGPGDWQRLLDAHAADKKSPLTRLVVAAHADDEPTEAAALMRDRAAETAEARRG